MLPCNSYNTTFFFLDVELSEATPGYAKINFGRTVMLALAK
jgi:hypothetical protein